MTEVLICTVPSRLPGVLRVLLPPMEGVCYLISCQGGEPAAALRALFERPDVRLIWMDGMGLSRNRNHAFQHAQGDFLVIADDDNALVGETLLLLPDDFDAHPEWDMIQYRMEGAQKPFPSPYVSSCELVLRRNVALHVRFDERFGLGSPYLASGEEEVFVFQVEKEGFRMGRMDRFLCRLNGPTTGVRFLEDARVQRSKGAVFALIHGRCRACWLCLREALSWMLRKRVNPVPLIRNMFWGIRYLHQ